tara:strand:- start:43 stop:573 length:531 start_codon:yes stop_codon:yes gene_type:complete
MNHQFDAHDTEYRVIREQFEHIGFSSHLARRLHDLMKDAHVELLTIGGSIPNEAIDQFPEIVTLAKTYAAWNLRSDPIPDRVAYRSDAAANHALIDDQIHIERTTALRDRLIVEKHQAHDWDVREKHLGHHIHELTYDMTVMLDRVKVTPARVAVDDIVDDDRCESDYADEYHQGA